MNVGDRITFPFGKGEKEGVVVRVHQKKVYLRVDFPRHKGKLICRKLHDLEAGPKKAEKAKRKKAKPKKKEE